MKNKPSKPHPSYSNSYKLGFGMRIANGQISNEQLWREVQIMG